MRDEGSAAQLTCPTSPGACSHLVVVVSEQSETRPRFHRNALHHLVVAAPVDLPDLRLGGGVKLLLMALAFRPSAMRSFPFGRLQVRLSNLGQLGGIIFRHRRSRSSGNLLNGRFLGWRLLRGDRLRRGLLLGDGLWRRT